MVERVRSPQSLLVDVNDRIAGLEQDRVRIKALIGSAALEGQDYSEHEASLAGLADKLESAEAQKQAILKRLADQTQDRIAAQSKARVSALETSILHLRAQAQAFDDQLGVLAVRNQALAEAIKVVLSFGDDTINSQVAALRLRLKACVLHHLKGSDAAQGFTRDAKNPKMKVAHYVPEKGPGQ
jgi:chromosome segregation ATPase